MEMEVLYEVAPKAEPFPNKLVVGSCMFLLGCLITFLINLDKTKEVVDRESTLIIENSRLTEQLDAKKTLSIDLKNQLVDVSNDFNNLSDQAVANKALWQEIEKLKSEKQKVNKHFREKWAELDSTSSALSLSAAEQALGPSWLIEQVRENLFYSVWYFPAADLSLFCRGQNGEVFDWSNGQQTTSPSLNLPISGNTKAPWIQGKTRKEIDFLLNQHGEHLKRERDKEVPFPKK